MRKIFNPLITIIILTPIFFSCQTGKEQKVNLEEDIRDIGEISRNIEEMVKNGKSIFYGLYSPAEVSSFFENVGAEYTPAILNSTENATNYVTSSKTALNLGIYGVDIIYIRMFDLPQESVNYWVVIEKLTNQLGIPDEVINTPRKSLEENINNPDSLIQIATATFNIAKNYLKEQNRESAATLIIIGGWIEAIYIATEALYDEENPDPEVVSAIAEQKYSLNSLISFAKNYHDDIEVAHYYRKLRLLQNYFKEFNIYYKKNDLRIDTVRKIIITSKSEIDITKENILKIKNLIKKTRDEIINGSY